MKKVSSPVSWNFEKMHAFLRDSSNFEHVSTFEHSYIQLCIWLWRHAGNIMRMCWGGAAILKRFRGYLEEMQGSPEAISRDSENNDKTIPGVSWGGARISWCDLQRFWERLYIGGSRGYPEEMQRSPESVSRDSENDQKIFRGYPEEVQGSPEAVSRDSGNDYILEDPEDILRRCKDLLKRCPEILRTIIFWKTPRIPWGDAKISWSVFQRFWERLWNDSEDTLRRCKDLLERFPDFLRTIIFWKIPRISWIDARISWSGFQRFWERVYTYWKIPRISWGDAQISWSAVPKDLEILRKTARISWGGARISWSGFQIIIIPERG